MWGLAQHLRVFVACLTFGPSAAWAETHHGQSAANPGPVECPALYLKIVPSADSPAVSVTKSGESVGHGGSGVSSGERSLAEARAEAPKANSGAEGSLKRELAEYKAHRKPVAEIKSLEHQDDVMRVVDDPKLNQALGHDERTLESMRQGILDSDQGKLGDYKRLMNPMADEDPLIKESDSLLDVLSGKATAGKDKEAMDVLRGVLDAGGHEGKWLLSPSLSNGEIRQAYTEAPVLHGFLHELPGMNDALKAFKSGQISDTQLADRLRANIGHNGPGESVNQIADTKIFWRKITEQFVPGSLAKASPSTARVLDGTIFKNGAGKVVYPKVMSTTGASFFSVEIAA